ncbi:MAG: leucine--tRNA ligase [Ignavibacteriales bacterium]|nr:MAG: leucine--tRNA ligase [Ignavibacteriaceae bacterium]MBW7872682.1 leucine--tRNA ligase [Ignavibacteria bacterium]MCZ2143403.1 leucine--tRNA ligase [Ignavibacteriales bacterium]OQY74086.1 MAG: leucine--tRNA ligase [Ignavibacteriales bacterium UTCHB3]MBV6444282.1 Leucine--tRNA ligase [Ignavibacteriaceae bacterium]
MRYKASEIEPKWQKFWEDKGIYKTNLNAPEKKLYSLVMFIYPSGAKLHCGHWYNYGPADTWARFKKLQGYNVFEPFGYDAFGLPAENYAIKTGVHPMESTLKNIDDIRAQIRRIGCMYDTNSELMTCDPAYYKWNQWLFLQLYKKGLAYRKKSPVNWCTSCQTVLANEQVLSDGSCERCGNPVVQKNLVQWFFKITDYADRLLDDLHLIDWPEETKTKQRNWIGKSTGAEVVFSVEGSDEKIKVFTTRPDTLFGVTYVTLAPEHPLVEKLTKPEFKPAVDKYVEQTAYLTEIDRQSTTKEKTGAPTGSFVINPINGEKVPIWIGDYVLLTYGTGCVMAVPGHDERDFEFAKKFDLPIRKVILQDGTSIDDEFEVAFTEAGTMVNSGKFDGMSSVAGKQAVIEELERIGAGKAKVNYRLRDWLISRQRYWGTPIPVVYCDKCGEVPLPEEQLPVTLPKDVEFKLQGDSPLKRHAGFMNTTCPKCGGHAERDPDTMDTFVDSSWYYLRFLDPKYEKGMFNTALTDNWSPVDMYIGGREHSVMHLLYARFIHKFLMDLGLVKTPEPFMKLVHQGTITNLGAKMSKSRGNVVNPEPYIDKYGSDVFRLYLMFMGPFELGGDWSDSGITGTERFAQKMYDLAQSHTGWLKNHKAADKYDLNHLSEPEKSVYRYVNRTLAKYQHEMEHLKFNTAIAALMELSNELSKNLNACRADLQTYTLQVVTHMIAPLAPHLAEEMAEILGREKSLFEEPWQFEPDPAALTVDSVTIAVQVSGKMRGTVTVPVDSDQDTVMNGATSDPKIAKFIDGNQVVKVIFVKNKILNVIVKQA